MPSKKAYLKKRGLNLTRRSENGPRKKQRRSSCSEEDKENVFVDTTARHHDSQPFSELQQGRLSDESENPIQSPFLNGNIQLSSEFAPFFHEFQCVGWGSTVNIGQVPEVETYIDSWSIKVEDDPLRLMDETDIQELNNSVNTARPEPSVGVPPYEPPPEPLLPTEPYLVSHSKHVASNGFRRRAPHVDAAALALKELQTTLRGESRGKSGGYKRTGLDPFTEHRLEGMRSMLSLYVNPRSATYNAWAASSLQAAISFDRGPYCAQVFRRLSRAYIEEREVLLINPYGDWNESMLSDEVLVADILSHIQGLGDQITAGKLRAYLSQDDVKEKHGITHSINLSTVQRWLRTLGFRFTEMKKGQYVDGHEREDVVWYRVHRFLPRWKQLETRMETFSKDGELEFGPRSEGGKPVLVHFHDESIFYANDRRRKTWYHKDAPAKPYPKGEGASLMVADFVSAKFGFLRSRDQKESARRVLKPGKARDGYFDAEGIQQQACVAMDILERDYPEYDHVLVYDNATIHLKRPDGSLSASKMPRNPSKPGKNWLVDITQRDNEGKIVYTPSGAPAKVKIQMQGAKFANGTPQPLYFPDDHPSSPGLFKGMALILRERGYQVDSKLLAQCGKNFQCKGNLQAPFDCCCRRLLFNEPDFANVDSTLETMCKARGFEVIFLPKFHCELNFIEQCWGYAKRLYRLNPPSSREEDLVSNTLAALDSIPLEAMRRFSNRALRFMDAYHRGLDGKEAVWAAKKYRGHRVLPECLLADLEKDGLRK